MATLPFLTLFVGALLRIETMTARKTAGVFLAMAGVGFPLAADVELAPEGAWRGEVLMLGTSLLISF